jgi:hypothetical protein
MIACSFRVPAENPRRSQQPSSFPSSSLGTPLSSKLELRNPPILSPSRDYNSLTNWLFQIDIAIGFVRYASAIRPILSILNHPSSLRLRARETLPNAHDQTTSRSHRHHPLRRPR